MTRARDRTDNPIADYPPKLYEQLVELGAMGHHAIDSGALTPEATVERVQEGIEAGRFALAL